jgi:hypothetical protein
MTDFIYPETTKTSKEIHIIIQCKRDGTITTIFVKILETVHPTFPKA